MSKNDKKNNTQLFDTPETQDSVSVSITYENDPADPKPTEQVIMEAEIKVEKPKEEPAPVDPKIKVLQEFAEIMKKHGKHGLVDITIGERLWRLWQDYTGRTDKWRRCSSCLIPKCMRLIKECQVHNISI